MQGGGARQEAIWVLESRCASDALALEPHTVIRNDFT
jgi:hypothetical protein